MEQYPYRHWLLAVTLGPLFSYFILSSLNESHSGLVALVAFPAGIIASLPTLPIVVLANKFICRYKISFISRRIFATLISIMGVVITSFVLSQTQMFEHIDLMPIMTAYILATLVSAYLIRRRFQN